MAKNEQRLTHYNAQKIVFTLNSNIRPTTYNLVYMIKSYNYITFNKQMKFDKI